MAKQPIIKATKQHIRLWFEFYKLALDERSLAKHIKASRAYYAAWGNVRDVKFDEWWKTHKHLFGETRVVEVSKITKHDAVLYLSIPLNQAVTTSIKQVKSLIEDRQSEQLKSQGIEPRKSKKAAFGPYQMTTGIELRGRPVYEAQLIYSEVYKPMGKPPVNTAFALKAREFFDNRPKAKWKPHILTADPQPDRKGNLRYSDDQLRSLRRYIKRAESLLLAAAKGDFPGRTYMK